MGEEETTRDPSLRDGLSRIWQDLFSARMMGFMFNQAWIYTLFFNAGLVPASDLQFSTLSILNIVSLAVLMVTMLVIGGLGPKLGRSVAGERRWLIVAAGLTLISTALVPISLLFPLKGATVIAAAVGTGIGSGSIMSLWGKAYSRTSGNVALAEASLASILAALLLPVYFSSPTTVQAVIVCLLPALSALFLFQELVSGPSADAAAQPHEGMPHSRKILAKVAVSSLIFSTTVTILRNLFEMHESHHAGDVGYSFVMAFPPVLAGAIMLAILLLGRHRIFALTYRPILPLLAFGCFLLPLFDRTSIYPYFFARVGYACFDILSWAILTDISVRSQFSPFRVFGTGRAAVDGGILMGSVIGLALSKLLPHSPETLTACSGILILALILTSTFILAERDVERIEPGRNSLSDAGQEESAALTLEEKIEIIGDRYALGERAREVLLLLARGKTGSRIEQELYISKGTVNYHLRNIYHKLGIHSKQELIELLEKMERPTSKN